MSADLGGYLIMALMAGSMVGGALFGKFHFTTTYWARRFTKAHR